MGVRVLLDGKQVEAATYRVQESSTPLAGGDSSGGVGTIDLTWPTDGQPYRLLEKPISFIDTSRGSTLGTIRTVDKSSGTGMNHLTANSRLGDFMIEAQVQPFTGTLENAFRYYCSVANIVGNIVVDPAVASIPVAFPGWSGNLWKNMKDMAIATSCDLNLISNNIVLRPIRLFETQTARDTESSVTSDGTKLAQKQEVIWYKTQHISNGLVYPPGGWTRDVKILSVNAGETAEHNIDLQSSVTSITQPVASTGIPPGWNTSSVYTIVGDDNIEIQPAQWRDYGGSLTVSINPDTRSLTVKMIGASGLVQINGQPMKVFRAALTAGTSDSTYSTLRIVGDAVHLNEQSLILPTGVAPYRTAQEFAPTIDNTFLNNIEDAYTAGTRGARRYAGRSMTLDSTVVAINKRGVTGDASFPPYSFADTLWAGKNYGQVKTLNAGKTYANVKADLYKLVANNFDNQVFGNIAGARVYDRESARWYRVRDAVTQWGDMSIQGDDDLTHKDIQKEFQGMTYGQVKARVGGKTYFDANLSGLAL